MLGHHRHDVGPPSARCWPAYCGIWILSPLINCWTPSGKTFWIRAYITYIVDTQNNRFILKSVFFLQIWYGEDVAAITQSLVEYYPYSFSSIHADNGTVPLDGYSEEPPCSTALFMPLVICYQTNCLGTTTTTAALGCIFSSCFSEFNALPQDCWNCMLLTGLNLTEIGIR